MKKRGFLSKKGSLIYGTIISVACVFSAGISTFAWFQAEANVQIQSTSSSTTISVSKPADIEVHTQLYYCTENHYSATHKGYTGTPTLTFDADDTDASISADSFVPVTTSDQKTLSGLFPGSKMTFMIKIWGDAALNGVGLQLMDLTPARAGRASSAESPAADIRNEFGGGYITLANAIRISTFVIDDEANFVSASVTGGSNGFTYVSGTESYTLRTKAGSFGSAAYVFYTVHFDDTPSSTAKTTYLEYTDSSCTSLYVGNTPSNTTRYFKQSENGDSNAYEGLTFTIKTLKVTVG